MYGQLLGRMAAECRIVRSTSAASWRSNRLAYAAWADWLPDLDPLAMDELSAQRELVRRYVAAYGPVDLEDVRWWTGWTKAATVAAADGIDLSKEGNAAAALPERGTWASRMIRSGCASPRWRRGPSRRGTPSRTKAGASWRCWAPEPWPSSVSTLPSTCGPHGAIASSALCAVDRTARQNRADARRRR